MESDITIKLNDFVLTEYMDLVASPDFGLLPPIQRELRLKSIVSAEVESKSFKFDFVLNHKNWSTYKDDIIKGIIPIDETKKLTLSLFPDRFWNVQVNGDNSFERSMDNKNEVFLSLEFIVPDGIAHATNLQQVVAKPDSEGRLSMEIDYEGTEETSLTLDIHNNAETGFLSAIGMHEDKNTFITQLGYVDEVDGEVREKKAFIFGSGDNTFANWKEASVFYENLNKAVVGTMPTTTSFGGWLGGIPANATNPQNKSWYGACRELVFHSAVENPYLWGRAWFETGKMGQTGEWTIAFVDENNIFVAGVALSKPDKVGNNATVYLLINEGNGSKIYKSIPFTPSYWNPPNPFGSQSRDRNRNMFDLRKEGSKITFFWNAKYYPVNVPFLKEKKVKRVQFYSGQYKGRTVAQSVSRIGIRDVTVSDLKSQYWQDLPNRFSEGSDVTITKENGMNVIYRNGIRTLEDLITGSDFPVLKPGKNKIEFVYSDFTKEVPKITGLYEKRWL